MSHAGLRSVVGLRFPGAGLPAAGNQATRSVLWRVCCFARQAQLLVGPSSTFGWVARRLANAFLGMKVNPSVVRQPPLQTLRSGAGDPELKRRPWG